MKREFTAEEVESIVHGDSDYEVIYENSTGSGRWSEYMESVVKVSEYMESIVGVEDRFYKFEWRRGLTEMQENEYYDQKAQEVQKIIETIELTRYEPVGD